MQQSKIINGTAEYAFKQLQPNIRNAEQRHSTHVGMSKMHTKDYMCNTEKRHSTHFGMSLTHSNACRRMLSEIKAFQRRVDVLNALKKQCVENADKTGWKRVLGKQKCGL